MKIKLSKSQWENIGKTAGWIRTARTLVDEEVDNWIASENATLKQKIDEPNVYKEIYLSEDNTITMEVTYEKFWEMRTERGAGYGFPCDKDGKLKVKPSVDAINAINSEKYKKPIIIMLGHVIRSGCPCGSGLIPKMETDARGIPLQYMCDKCKKEKLSHYRPEVLTNPSYESDEPIEEI